MKTYCTECGGSGIEYQCPACGGSGKPAKAQRDLETKMAEEAARDIGLKV